MRLGVVLRVLLSLHHVASSPRLVQHFPDVKSVNDNSWQTLDGNAPTIIGHRGEKFLMPEHTVGSYEVACIEGADYVEPDLVLTRDNHLVCFHDLTLKAGTNVAELPQLAYLKRNYTGPLGVNNVTIEDDWFIPDLTLAQIKMLTVVQAKVGVRPQYFNELFKIPTFQEYLEVVHNMAAKLKSSIGVIPELKHPDFINSAYPTEFHMERRVLEVLRHYGYPIASGDLPTCTAPASNTSIPCGHLILQSFDRRSLEYLSTLTRTQLMMLVDDDPGLLTRRALEEVSNFATYYSVWKEVLFSGVEPVLTEKGVAWDPAVVAEEGGFIPKETFVAEVHGRNLQMGIYTLYDSREPSYMGCAVECRPENKTFELFYYFGLGVDAFFVENIKEATELRTKYGYEMRISTGNGSRRLEGLKAAILLTVSYVTLHLL